MTSRKNSGPGNLIAPAMDATQATSILRSQLKTYTAFANTINSTLKDANQVHSELDQENKPLPLVAKRLNAVWDVIGEQTNEEIKRIDQALETLDRLERLQASQPVALSFEQLSPSFDTAPLPLPAAGGVSRRGPYKKRPKDGNSAAPSPAPSAAPSPAAIPLASPSTSTIPLPRISKSQQQQPIAPASHPSPANSAASSSHTPAAAPFMAPPVGQGERRKPVTNQHRKQALQGQLPLAPGRQVAFRQPSTKGGSHVDSKREEWILARVNHCIQGDKNRYAVEDVDPDPEGTEQQLYNTTLKSIVPLPDPRDRERTYPAQSFPIGARVMALYPDTTSFYRAVIISGPAPEKGKKKERVYEVQFDDDDGNIKTVPIELVVDIP